MVDILVDNDYRVSDEEDAEVVEVMSLVGVADGVWSEVVLSGEENTWQKGGDTVNVCNFGGAVGELNFDISGWMKGVAMVDSDWDEDNWESVWTERMFDLGNEDGGGDLINDDCDNHDDDNCNNGCGDNTSCKVSIINFENLMFPFSIRWRWSL